MCSKSAFNFDDTLKEWKNCHVNSGGVLKSAVDKRIYQVLTLPNQLEVLLIQDKEIKRSAACMDVHVGHFSDPWNLPGLAHFCEHMLFLGTSKYPDEAEYKRFINTHGGNCNASTGTEHTKYYFQIDNVALEGALDRFAQFFIDPLFTQSATDRELNAIHSEYSKNLQNDHRRLFQLHKQLSASDHVFSKFSTGNLTTLKHRPEKVGVDIREALLQFHETHYSSNIMKLCILSDKPLEDMATMVRQQFTAVSNKNITIPHMNETHLPYGRKELQSLVRVVPVKDIKILQMVWPLPPMWKEYQSNSTSYVSHLIGDEGDGSILSLLKAQGLANSLSAGLTYSSKHFSVFKVQISLTDSGVNDYMKVGDIVFQYIKLLNETPPEEWIYVEKSRIQSTMVRFMSQQSSSSSTVVSLAGAMHSYDTQDVIIGPYMSHAFKSDQITDIIQSLSPNNLLMTLTSKSVHTDVSSTSVDNPPFLTEEWYGTQYHIEDIASTLIYRWNNIGRNSLLKLPLENQFLPEKFDVIYNSSGNDNESLMITPKSSSSSSGCPNSFPVLLVNKDNSRVWWRQCSEFKLPKGNIITWFRSPVVVQSTSSYLSLRLFSLMISDELDERFYAAGLAGLHVSVAINSIGSLKVSVDGYSDKLKDFHSEVIKFVRNFTIIHPSSSSLESNYDDSTSSSTSTNKSRLTFDRLKDKLKRVYMDVEKSPPASEASRGLNYSLVSGDHLKATYWKHCLDSIDGITLDDVITYRNNLFHTSGMYSEHFVFGNFSETEAMSINASTLDSMQPCRWVTESFSSYCCPRGISLDVSSDYLIRQWSLNSSEPCSATSVLYYIGQDSVELNAKLRCVLQIIQQPFFYNLRTQQQIGYLVHANYLDWSGVLGLNFQIQTEKYSPDEVDSRIDVFVKSFSATLEAMTETEYETFFKAVSLKLREPPKNMKAVMGEYTSVIQNQTYLFGKKDKIASCIDSLEKDDIVKFWKDYIVDNGSSQCKITSQVYSAKYPDDIMDLNTNSTLLLENSSKPFVVIKDPFEFTKSMPLLPSHRSIAAMF